jgi:hypothetical protein
MRTGRVHSQTMNLTHQKSVPSLARHHRRRILE